MNRIRIMSKLNRGFPYLVMLLVLLLPGCTPKLTVTCGGGCGNCGTGEPGTGVGGKPVGACSPIAYSGSAVGFISVNGPPGETQVPSTSGATCTSGSTKCGSPAGTCNRKTCVNYYDYSDNSCWCGCQ